MNSNQRSSISQSPELNNSQGNDLSLEIDFLGQRLLEDATSKEIHDENYELDCVDIPKGRPSKKRFLNRVFSIHQQKLLFRQVDLKPLLAQRDFSKKLKTYLIFCFFYTLINGFLVFRAIQDEPALAKINSLVDSIMNEYKTDPMVEIRVSDSSNTCPPAFDPMLLEKWPGTYAACFCPSQNILKQGKCSSHTDLPDGCSDIQETLSSNLYSWGGVSSLCVRRAQLNSNYVKSETCPKGYKTCSFGVCMTDSTPCPVTSLLVTNSSVSTESIQIDSSKYITPQRELDQPPLVNLAITQNFSPSLFIKEGPSESAEQELLDQELNKILDSSNASQLLSLNHVTGDIYQIPIYQSSLKGQIVDLMARRRLEIVKKEDCFGIEDDPNLHTDSLYGRIIALHCGLIVYYASVMPLAYFKLKRPRVQQFLQSPWIQLAVFFLWFGFLILWTIVCQPLGRSKNIINNCFETPALDQILEDLDDTIFFKKVCVLLSWFLILYPLSHFKIVKD